MGSSRSSPRTARLRVGNLAKLPLKSQSSSVPAWLAAAEYAMKASVGMSSGRAGSGSTTSPRASTPRSRSLVAGPEDRVPGRCGSRGRPSLVGFSRRRSTCRGRRCSISAAAATGSHRGMIIIGMNRPGTPPNSSRMKSFQACTQSRASLVLGLVEDLAAVPGNDGKRIDESTWPWSMSATRAAGLQQPGRMSSWVMGSARTPRGLAGDGVEPGGDDLAVPVRPELESPSRTMRDRCPATAREGLLPEAGRLDEVVVDGDEPGDRHVGPRQGWVRTGRSPQLSERSHSIVRRQRRCRSVARRRRWATGGRKGGRASPA